MGFGGNLRALHLVRVQVSAREIWGVELGLTVQGSWCRGLRFRIEGLKVTEKVVVQGLGSGVQGLGVGVDGLRVWG